MDANYCFALPICLFVYKQGLARAGGVAAAGHPLAERVLRQTLGAQRLGQPRIQRQGLALHSGGQQFAAQQRQC